MEASIHQDDVLVIKSLFGVLSSNILHDSVRADSFLILQFLGTQGTKADAQAVALAIQHGSHRVFRTLMAFEHVDVCARHRLQRDKFEFTALGRAAALGRAHMTRDLVRRGANVNGLSLQCSSGRTVTPAQLAAWHAQPEALLALHAVGANMHGAVNFALRACAMGEPGNARAAHTLRLAWTFDSKHAHDGWLCAAVYTGSNTATSKALEKRGGATATTLMHSIRAGNIRLVRAALVSGLDTSKELPVPHLHGVSMRPLSYAESVREQHRVCNQGKGNKNIVAICRLLTPRRSYNLRRARNKHMMNLK